MGNILHKTINAQIHDLPLQNYFAQFLKFAFFLKTKNVLCISIIKCHSIL